MGGSESKTVVNKLSQQINDISTKLVQECVVTADQSQQLEVINTGFKFWGNYKLKQETDIKSDCFSSLQKQVDLQNQIYSAISQSSTASGVAVLSAFGSSSSTAETNLKSIIQNTITLTNIQKNYNVIKNQQSAVFINSGVVGFEQTQLTQGASIFAAATLETIDKAGIFNTITDYVDQNSSADTSMFNLFGGLGAYLPYLMVFIVVIAIGMASSRYMGNDAQDNTLAPPTVEPAQ
jgi:hypothetical protein